MSRHPSNRTPNFQEDIDSARVFPTLTYQGAKTRAAPSQTMQAQPRRNFHNKQYLEEYCWEDARNTKSSWKTTEQKNQRLRRAEDCVPTELDLPSLSPRHKTDSVEVSDCEDQEVAVGIDPSSRMTSVKEPKAENLMEVLVNLLPIVVQFFLCNQLTDKVECFLKVGRILKADDVVAKALIEIELSSLSNSQQN